MKMLDKVNCELQNKLNDSYIVCRSSYILKYFFAYKIGCVINAITIFIS